MKGGMSGTILYPGFGSDWMDGMELTRHEGKWFVTGTAYESMSGFNVPEGCPPMPISVSVPINCLRNLDEPFSAWPKEDEI